MLMDFILIFLNCHWFGIVYMGLDGTLESSFGTDVGADLGDERRLRTGPTCLGGALLWMGRNCTKL